MSVLQGAPAPAAHAAHDGETAREVFVAWERRRIAYNAVQVAVVALSGRILFEGPGWAARLGLLVLASNLLFCLGPVAEGYLVLLGAPRRGARAFVFTLGTLVAVALAGLVIVGQMFRSFD